MGDILSQSEIDALLNAVKSEEKEEQPAVEADISESKVTKYDFYSPKKFTKERIKLLGNIYENFARGITSYFKSMLRMNCEVNYVEIEEQRYYEVRNALYQNDVLVKLQANIKNTNHSYPIMFYVNNFVVYTFIDRLLGGDGTYKFDPAGMVYTKIELSIYEYITSMILPVMEGVWKNYIDMDIKFDKMESNADVDQETPLDEIIAIVVLNITINDKDGKINVFLPRVFLENVFKILDKEGQKRKKEPDSEDIRNTKEILSNIKNSKLEIKAMLPKVDVSLQDINELNVGDIISFGKNGQDEILLHIKDRPWFTGSVGKYKDNIAVKIDGVYRKKKNFLNLGKEE